MDFKDIQRQIDEDLQHPDAIVDHCRRLDTMAAGYDYLRQRYDHETALALLQLESQQFVAHLRGCR